MRPIHFDWPLRFILSAMLVSGCSSSSEPQPFANTQSATADEAESAAEDVTSSGESGISNDGAGIDDSTSDTAGEPLDNTSSTSQLEPVNTDPVIPDPIVQIRTQVNFEIMVPMYQSDALKIRLIWGNTDTTANWIGDEFWSASADLPTDTEHLLAITFYDNNGEIELGSYEKMYRTGSNAAESYQVLADQFDTARWDTDGDGIGNLDELIAETDPLVDEDSLLEIHDSADFTIGTPAARYEALISDERPYVSTTINVDIDGNGTRYYSNRSDYYNQVESRASRTNTGNSIFWEGTTRLYDGDYTTLTTFTSDVAIVDESTRVYIEEINRSYSGTYRDTRVTNSNITGELIEGTSFCKPVSGTVSSTSMTTGGSPRTTSISKEIDDSYWRVKFVIGDDEPTEYFARELHASSGDFPEVTLLKCDFVDF